MKHEGGRRKDERGRMKHEARRMQQEGGRCASSPLPGTGCGNLHLAIAVNTLQSPGMEQKYFGEGFGEGLTQNRSSCLTTDA